MKLFVKYNRINLLATIIIFLFASLAFYLALRYILMKQVDEDLRIEQHEIETYVKEHSSLPESIPVKDQKITYTATDEILKRRKFSNIEIYDSIEKEKNPHRVLLFTIKVNDTTYAVTVAKSLERTDVLINSILLISFSTILLILAATFIINRILLKRLWKPFYGALDVLKSFKLDRSQSLNFPSTNIDEFGLMNQTLETTTSQAKKDYLLLKEFTENASHEMQTPLSIIRSKLDLFIQHENLSEDQSRTMQSAYLAVEKLTRLNQSLLLLAKIENNQYAETTTVELKQKLEEKTEAFHELWQNQNITVTTSLQESAVTMNKELADILLNNLLSNATRHNYPGGFIHIELKNDQLKITNSSKQNQLDQQRLFSRFYKETNSREQNGLGLSIIKQICDASGFRIHYSFENGKHSFITTWV
ncbi:MAG: sensor histidine kinase [Chitinophagales bacterium]